nr:hypothetical protein [Pseudomonas aeruginosa]
MDNEIQEHVVQLLTGQRIEAANTGIGHICDRFNHGLAGDTFVDCATRRTDELHQRHENIRGRLSSQIAEVELA